MRISTLSPLLSSTKHNLFVVKQFGQNPNGKDGVEDVRANSNNGVYHMHLVLKQGRKDGYRVIERDNVI